MALNTTLKILDLLGSSEVPVGYSTLQPVNPFPAPWRWAAAQVDTLPVLNSLREGELERIRKRQLISDLSGQELLAQIVMNGSDPTTLVVTGPLSNVAHAIQAHGEAFTSKVSEVWWMGGALRVQGNVYAQDLPEKSAPTDGSAGELNHVPSSVPYCVWNRLTSYTML